MANSGLQDRWRAWRERRAEKRRRRDEVWEETKRREAARDRERGDVCVCGRTLSEHVAGGNYPNMRFDACPEARFARFYRRQPSPTDGSDG